ncbi:MAG: hypothetical protein KAI20_01365 [Thermoplasmatales archaeon]|nr:hypothetical protein [Thermoplasmatales archaeon]
MATITLTIPEENLEDFLEAFLRCNPMSDYTPKGMTELGWVKQHLQYYALKQYEEGKSMIINDEAKEKIYKIDTHILLSKEIGEKKD